MIRVLNKPTSLRLGGAETTVMNFYRNIDRSKVQFDFLMTRSNADEPQFYSEEAISLGARIFYQPLKLKFFFKNLHSLSRLLKENPEIKIIHIHGSSASTCSKIALFAMFAGTPNRIVHSRNALQKVSVAHKLCQPLLRFVSTHWLACSTEAGQSLFGKKHFQGKRALLYPNARDLEPFRFSQERRKNARLALGVGSQKVLLNIARLASQKNQSFLLDVFATALNDPLDMIFLIAGGDRGLMGDLKSKAEKLGISDKVNFLGERNDIPELLHAADMFLLPSLHEGLPGVAIEAQAAGLPCLLSDTVSRETKVTDLVEFLPIDEGPEVWAKRIVEIVDYVRRDTIEDVKSAGYDIKDAAKRLEDFYLSLV